MARTPSDLLQVLTRVLLVLCMQGIHVVPAAAQATGDPAAIRAPAGQKLQASAGGKSAEVWVVGCSAVAGPIPLVFGDLRVVITLSAPLEPLQTETDTFAREGYCRYSGYGVASFQLSTGDLEHGGSGTFALSLPITWADIDFYFRLGAEPDDVTAYRDIHLYYSDSGTRAIVVWPRSANFPFDFVLNALGVIFAVDDAGTATLQEAYLEVRMDVRADVHLGGPVYLSGDLTSPIRYTWNAGATSWHDGSWSLDALAFVELQVRRDGVFPVATAALAVDASGHLQATLQLTDETTWSAAGYRVRLETCTLEVHVNLNEWDWRFVQGSLQGGFEAGPPVTGAFTFEIVYEATHLRMAIASNSSIRAFGVPVQNLALAVDLDPNMLSFKEVTGSVTFAHPDFNQAIAIQRFQITEGRLVEFVGAGRAGYKGFQLVIERISYQGVQPARLDVAATLGLGWSKTGTGTVDINNFSIDASGNISNFDIAATVAASPVDVRLVAVFTETQFSGRFNGTFAGTASFSGTVVIGAVPPPDDFSYGYLSMALELSRGVPIGNSGLQLLGLNGAFGVNYLPEGSPLEIPAGPAVGLQRKCDKEGPCHDIYYLQTGLTVGDVGRLAQLNGTVSLVLGARASAIQIAGRLQVTQQQPYMVGSLSCNYVLGSGTVSGVLASSIRLPTSGSVVRAENNVLLYRMQGGGWSVRSAAPLSAELFGFVRLHQGSVQLKGELLSPVSSMQGRLGGRVSAESQVVVDWPSGFRPWGDGNGAQCSPVRQPGQVLDCGCANSTASTIGLGAVGGLTLSLQGSLNATLDRTGTSGSFEVEAYFAGSAAITLPISGWFAEPCARSLALAASSRLQATTQHELLSLKGDIRFVDGAGNELITLPFEQTL